MQVSKKFQYKTDTLSFSDTISAPLGNSPVFQSGKRFLIQNYTDVNTHGYFGAAFPMWLNAREKLQFYAEPGIGFASYSYSTFQIDPNGRRLNHITVNQQQERKLISLSEFPCSL